MTCVVGQRIAVTPFRKGFLNFRNRYVLSFYLNLNLSTWTRDLFYSLVATFLNPRSRKSEKRLSNTAEILQRFNVNSTLNLIAQIA